MEQLETQNSQLLQMNSRFIFFERLDSSICFGYGGDNGDLNI